MNEPMKFTHNGITLTLIGVTVKLYENGKWAETIEHRSRRAAKLAYSEMVADEIRHNVFSSTKSKVRR
jgi:hypothetical protein